MLHVKMNSTREINVKNSMYYFFDDMINIKTPDSNKIMTDENSYKNILFYYISYLLSKTRKIAGNRAKSFPLPR